MTLQSMSDQQNDKLILITKKLYERPRGGREMLSKLNHDALASIFGERLIVYELPSFRGSIFQQVIKALNSHIDGLSVSVIEEIIDLIICQNASHVFVDGSNLGSLIYALKKSRLSRLKTICFFHNVEVRFFWGSLVRSKTLRSLAVLIVNFFAERNAVLHSDHIISLSSRDSQLLKKIYGKSATHISPISLEDKCRNLSPNSPLNVEQYALFVGSDFYANRHGICWFVQNVVPHINIKVCIVGNGMEDLRSQLEIPGRVEVVGSVDDLGIWYVNSFFTIAPIFDGSGMKTKVAESLMFGKKVVGTPEAFTGYEQFTDRIGWCCKTPADFVSAINIACNSIGSGMDPELRALYLDQFSLPAATFRLAGLFDKN